MSTDLYRGKRENFITYQFVFEVKRQSLLNMQVIEKCNAHEPPQKIYDEIQQPTNKFKQRIQRW